MDPAAQNKKKEPEPLLTPRLKGLNIDEFELILSNDSAVDDFAFPRDFPSLFSYFVTLLSQAEGSTKDHMSALAIHSLTKSVRGQAWKFAYRSLVVLTVCPHHSHRTVCRLVHQILLDASLRQKPSLEEDIHRQSLFCLAEHISGDGRRSGLIDITRRYLNESRYALAAQAVLQRQDRDRRSVDTIPRVALLLEAKGVPTTAFAKFTAKRLGGEVRLWRKLGASLKKAGAPAAILNKLTAHEHANPGPASEALKAGLAQGSQVRPKSPVTKSDTRRTFEGVVTRDVNSKTRRVEVQRMVRHPKYGKFLRRRTICYAHDEMNDSHLGDVVEIVESRPLSRMKRWQLIRVLQRSPTRKLSNLEGAIVFSDSEKV